MLPSAHHRLRMPRHGNMATAAASVRLSRKSHYSPDSIAPERAACQSLHTRLSRSHACTPPRHNRSASRAMRRCASGGREGGAGWMQTLCSHVAAVSCDRMLLTIKWGGAAQYASMRRSDVKRLYQLNFVL